MSGVATEFAIPLARGGNRAPSSLKLAAPGHRCLAQPFILFQGPICLTSPTLRRRGFFSLRQEW